MKSVVFFFLLLLVLPVQAVSAESVYLHSFPGYDIQLTYQADDNGNRGYRVDKIGQEPFSTMLMYEDTWLGITGVTEIEGNHVLYGYVHEDGAETFYEGLIIVLSPSGETLHKLVLDEGVLEEVLGVYVIDQLVFVYMAGSRIEERDIVMDRSVFYTFDYNYEAIDRLELFEIYEEYEATDRLFVFNRAHDHCFDGAITPQLEVIERSDPLPIATDQVFEGEVFIPFVDKATLNRDVIYHGVTVDYPGNYELSYNGRTYPFTLRATVTGIEDGATYSDSVTPVVPAGNVHLNGDLFVSGTEISEPGFYELAVRGVNGYREVWRFTIVAHVSGVIHNQRYEDSVEITFQGDGYLNNNYVESPLLIEEPGEYILRVTGANEYEERYHFAIVEPPVERTFMGFLQDYDLVLLGVTVVAGLLVLKKK